MAKSPSKGQSKRHEQHAKKGGHDRLARQLEIGARVSLHRGKDPQPDTAEVVRALHELCSELRSPHVHIITNKGVYCRGFRSFV